MSRDHSSSSAHICQYWIHGTHGDLVLASDVREADSKAEHGPYALCDAESVWHVAASIPLLLKEFTRAATNDLDELEKALVAVPVSWRVFPVSEGFAEQVREFFRNNWIWQGTTLPRYQIENSRIRYTGTQTPHQALLRAMHDHKQAEAFIRVRNLCAATGGRRGIWKRIDENRELLAFLQGNAPGLLARYPFMEGWLGKQDIFLVNLLRLLELPDALPSFGAGFPRPWPGNPALERPI